MSKLHLALNLLASEVASLIDRVEQLEAENAALMLLVRPSPAIPFSDVPVREVTGVAIEEEME